MQPAKRVALITGAANPQGIGWATARALAASGVDIVITDRRFGLDQPEQASAADPTLAPVDCGKPVIVAAPSPQFEGLGVRVLAVTADLADPGTPARLLNLVNQALGPVDILVNNAAYSLRDGLDEFNADLLDAHYAVNMRGAMLLAVEFARRFAKGSGGRIINLTSGQGTGPMPDELAYGATKGAIEAFTLSLSASVAARGITVNAVDPGPTDTGWIWPELRHELEASAPMGRVGLPDDAANLICFLASPQAAWITGQIIRSRGGF